jgi:hypothetical protein
MCLPPQSASNVRHHKQGRAENDPTTISQRIGIDDLERQVIANINEFGWDSVHVLEDNGHYPWTPEASEPFKEWHHVPGEPRSTVDFSPSR